VFFYLDLNFNSCGQDCCFFGHSGLVAEGCTILDRLKAPPRILRIIARLNVGGPARHVVLLTEKLREKGWESDLVIGEVGPGEVTCPQ